MSKFERNLIAVNKYGWEGDSLSRSLTRRLRSLGKKSMNFGCEVSLNKSRASERRSKSRMGNLSVGFSSVSRAVSVAESQDSTRVVERGEVGAGEGGTGREER